MCRETICSFWCDDMKRNALFLHKDVIICFKRAIWKFFLRGGVLPQSPQVISLNWLLIFISFCWTNVFHDIFTCADNKYRGEGALEFPYMVMYALLHSRASLVFQLPVLFYSLYIDWSECTVAEGFRVSM